ncbi:hypothetical protein [Bacillus sp. UMB0728]|uniref:hypothetical protein n=1 Tax=Bacillus sp. UMB0728 TaxID=2066052 RepID=UPI000C76FA8C|nr:hypothetical protein [Bacillus sp. UMB0728]PLR70593.1 hypothetical protein CYJ37_23995 [Bacillus sp. UMB0728]
MAEILPSEDKDLALESIVNDLLIRSLDKDIGSIKQSKLKLKGSYIKLLEDLHDIAIKEASQIKKMMMKKGIKILSQTVINSDFVSYQYIVRGYTSEFRFLKPALKKHVENRLELYLNKL